MAAAYHARGYAVADRQAAEARELAAELAAALDDPKRDEWGGYPWEHLGDAERDVRVLLLAPDTKEPN